jgi:predicted ester cyclase
MAIDLKQVQRRLIDEAFGNGNIGAYDELCDTGYVAHDVLEGDLSLTQAKEMVQRYRMAFPDLKVQLLGSFLDGNIAVLHWRMAGTHQGKLLAIEPTGTRCAVEGITISRFRGGKLLEEWTQWDALGLLRQLEVTSFAQAAPEKTARTRQQRA